MMISWNEVKCLDCKQLLLYTGCNRCKNCEHQTCTCDKVLEQQAM